MSGRKLACQAQENEVDMNCLEGRARGRRKKKKKEEEEEGGA